MRPILATLASLAGVALLASSCSSSGRSFVLVEDALDGAAPPPPPPFEDTSDASIDARASAAVEMCPTNECPPGRLSCPNNPLLCAVDLSSDNDNCGECGHKCPATENPILGYDKTVCIGGECKLQCTILSGVSRLDCNGLPDDGCEAIPTVDNNNCGGCGIVCPTNYTCMYGTCACAITNSCGGCGNVCPPPPDNFPTFPPAWHVEYRCDDDKGVCNVAQCSPRWADCDGDFTTDPTKTSNGCETNTTLDASNCGGCGVTCAAGEVCEFSGDRYQFNGVSGPGRGECVCPCGSSCFDLSSDVRNCGMCNKGCGGIGAHQYDYCQNGKCEYECDANWRDCNSDGICETNVRSDPANCGGCGIRCDGVEGQPCIDGQCAMKECGGIQ